MCEEKPTRVVHCKKEKYDLYIGRPSVWGNPFSHLPGANSQFQVNTREDAVKEYEKWIHTQQALMDRLYLLKGKVLGCWCNPKACHGDVLARLADERRT